MLEIFNSLSVFFEDCYRKVNVREYAKLTGVSPPTASTLLKGFEKENLLKTVTERRNNLYWANRENPLFVDLSKAYWRQKLKLLAQELAEQVNYEAIILFGSLIKGETTISSDVDIYLNSNEKRISLEKHEKSLKRKIQLHFKKELANDYLRRNIQKGLLLNGMMMQDGLGRMQSQKAGKESKSRS
jgi:predicted nucleotidyltransferase